MFVLQALLVVSAAATDGPTTLIQFTAPWCSPCRSMEPTVQRLVQKKYPVLVVDIDQRKDLADRFGVREIPCFVMLVKGREAERATGIVSYDRFVQMYQRAGLGPQSSMPPTRQVAVNPPQNSAPYHRSGAQSQRSIPQVNPAMVSQGSLPIRTVNNAFAGNGSAKNSYANAPAPQGSRQSTNQSLTPQQRAMYATVRLKVSDPRGHSFGTGTVIDSHGNEALVLTCAHVFRDSNGRGITADLFAPGAGKARPCELIAMDMEKDIALVSVKALAPVVVAKVASQLEILQPGRGVFSVGCNRGADPTLERGRIVSIDRYLGPPNIEVSGKPEIGRSGGGLFANDGQLIGVCNAADETDNEGIYASLPIVHWQLAQVGMQRLYQQQQSAPASNQMLAQQNPGARTPQPAHHIPTTPASMPANRAATMVPISVPQHMSQMHVNRTQPNSIQSGTLNELLGMLAQNPSSTSVSYRNAQGQTVTLDRNSIIELQRLAAANAARQHENERFAARQRYIQPDLRDSQGRIIRAQSNQ